MKINKDIEEFSIQELFQNDQYKVPLYQRNYAWGEEECIQLVQDVCDYAKNGGRNNYYIGTLVTFPREEGGKIYYEVIDGQQRLTTLAILLCVLKNNSQFRTDLSWFKKINISFEKREKSDKTLKKIYETSEGMLTPDKSLNENIWSVYKYFKSNLSKECAGRDLCEKDFFEYLLKKVIILRVGVPQQTNLNKYFEVMNSRGEQLEQHEIIKALLMSNLKTDNERKFFSQIWDVCSDMDKYIQLGFPKKIRAVIFKAEIEYQEKSFEQFLAEIEQVSRQKNSSSADIFPISAEKCEEINLLTLLENDSECSERIEETTSEKEEREIFPSLITFPNFLLHVLKIMCEDRKEELPFGDSEERSEIPLDDKRLVQTFSTVLNKNDKYLFTKDFAANLLKLRFLFDKYLIKRDNSRSRNFRDTETEIWTLKQLKKIEKISPDGKKSDCFTYVNTFGATQDAKERDSEPENKKLILLLSMFHVSYPSQIYKNWMYAALRFVYQNPTVTAKEYEKYLWNLARAFLIDRYLTPKNLDEMTYANLRQSFDEIISKNNGNCVGKISGIYWEGINIRDDTPHWHRSPNEDVWDIWWGVNNVEFQRGENVENFVFNFFDFLLWKNSPDKNKDFSFSHRNSVEHFFPQQDPIKPKAMPWRFLHSFGNLALVSRSLNSKLSNDLPTMKADFLSPKKNLDGFKKCSLKLRSMVDIANKGDWTEHEIEQEEKKAKQFLETELAKEMP